MVSSVVGGGNRELLTGCVCVCVCDAVCWRIEPGDRPTFVDILLQLEEIGHSAFITTSHASFRSLQQTWRVEIESRFAELRTRDDVRTSQHSSSHSSVLHLIAYYLRQRNYVFVGICLFVC